MTEPNIAKYFAEFNPQQAQIKKLSRLLKNVHKWWGIEYGDSIIKATLVVAPRELAKLSPPALDLLNRCQNRIWAFKIRLDRIYNPYYKQTYQELFDLLLKLGLVKEGSIHIKIAGSKKISELQQILKTKGLSDKGKKNELMTRLINNLSEEELKNLTSKVILYTTTDAGDEAIKTIKELQHKMELTFRSAVIGTMDYFEAQKPLTPQLRQGVLYDDGEVLITEEDARAAQEKVSRMIEETIKKKDTDVFRRKK